MNIFIFTKYHKYSKMILPIKPNIHTPKNWIPSTKNHRQISNQTTIDAGIYSKTIFHIYTELKKNRNLPWIFFFIFITHRRYPKKALLHVHILHNIFVYQKNIFYHISRVGLIRSKKKKIRLFLYTYMDIDFPRGNFIYNFVYR